MRTASVLAHSTCAGSSSRDAAVIAPPAPVAPSQSCLLSRPVWRRGVGRIMRSDSCSSLAWDDFLAPTRLATQRRTDDKSLVTTHHLLSRLSPFLRDGLLTSPASSHSPPLHSRDSLTLQLRPTFHNPPFCPPLLVHTLALHLQCGIVQSVSHGQSHSISTPRKVGSSASFQFYLCRGRSHTHADSNHTD
jgi:hypothetical protein